MAPLLQVLQMVTVFALYGSGFTSHVEIVPQTVNELVTDEVTVTCLADDYSCWTKKVVIIELGKKGQRPIAVLGRAKKDLELMPALKTRMQAEGHIHKNFTQSYLHIKMKSPLMEDSGTYSCRLFYLDSFGKLKEDRAEANLTVDNENETPVYVHLLNRILLLEETVSRQKEKIADQEHKIADQENKTAEQEIKIAEQQNKIANQENKIAEQENKTTNQENKLDMQEIVINQEKDSIAQYQHKVDNQSKELIKLQDHIEELETKASYTTAFSMGYDNRDKLHLGRTVLFKEPIMEIGQNYNNETGIFTAPVTGLYVFHLTVLSYVGKNYVYIDLKANNKVVATLYAVDNSYSDQTSSSTIVLLKTGEEVKPVVRNFGGGSDYLYYIDHDSVFTGYLLKPL